jgi:hypothetical protein
MDDPATASPAQEEPTPAAPKVESEAALKESEPMKATPVPSKDEEKTKVVPTPETLAANGNDKESVRTIFQKHDMDGNGRLSIDELVGIMKELKLLSEDGDLEYEELLRDHFLEISDKDGDDELDFEEVWEGLLSWEKQHASSSTPPAGGSASAGSRFDAARFEPIMIAAVANFLASVWEDVFDRTQADIEDAITDDATVWFDVAASTVHLLVVLILVTHLRFLCAKIPYPRTRALTIKSVQILAGWSCKGLVYYFGTAFQAELTQSATISYCEAWLPPTCMLVLLAFAILITGLAALTALLPTATPPKRYGCRSLGLHLSALIVGAVALPVGYSWHLVSDDLFAWMTLRLFTTECDSHTAGDPPAQALTGPGRPGGGGLIARMLSEDYNRLEVAAVEWLVHSVSELLYAFLALALFAVLKRRINRRVAASAVQQKDGGGGTVSSRSRRISERLRNLASRTFDFIIAWALFDVVAALYTSLGSSYCFPSHGGELELEKWSTLFVYFLLLLMLGVLRATNLSAWGFGGCETCCRGPSTLCGRETPALAWGVVLNTLGIQIGWSLHGAYAGIEDFFIDDDTVEHLAATLILIAVVTTLVFIVTFLFVTERRKRRTGTVLPMPPA